MSTWGSPRCPPPAPAQGQSSAISATIMGRCWAEDTGTNAEGTGLSKKQKGSPQAVQADSQTRQGQGKKKLLIFDAAAGVLPA